jgi:hypothetical protein
MEKTDIKSFNETINRIDQEIAELRLRLSSSRLKIVQLCDEVTAQIDLAVELRIQELQKLRDEHLRKIKIYKEECMANMAQAEEKFTATVAMADEFVKKWLQQPADSSCNDIKDQKIDLDATQHLNKLVKLQEELKAFQFSGHVLKFKDTERPDSLGRLELDLLELPRDFTLKKPISLPISIFILIN